MGCTDVSRCAGGCAETRIKAPVEGGSTTHQTSPIVKLGDPEHFTNSHPYEAILGAIDASWGVLSRKNFRRWLKKNGHMANLASRRAQKWANFFSPWYQNLPPGKVTGKGS